MRALVLAAVSLFATPVSTPPPEPPEPIEIVGPVTPGAVMVCALEGSKFYCLPWELYLRVLAESGPVVEV